MFLLYFSTIAAAAEMFFGCPKYEDYAIRIHGMSGLGLPAQRPVQRCRLFVSKHVDAFITEMNAKIKDIDVATLFENCLPNTLDTTIRWHDSALPETFVITGDINAQWIRDSTFQLEPYHQFLKDDDALKLLVRGTIQTQAKFLVKAPYCNAFQPPLASGLRPTRNNYMDYVNPTFNSDEVFECKYEIDSLGSFLRLSRKYYAHTKDDSFFTPEWLTAVQKVLRVATEQSQPSFDATTGKWNTAFYTWRRQTDSATETLALQGSGFPVNDAITLVRSAFRPSDTIYQYFVPGNAMFSVELSHLANLLDIAANKMSKALSKWSETAREMSKDIKAAIYEHAVFEHPEFGKVFAFEIDGYGGRVVMDDANVPSLLSLPLLGFLEKDDPIYLNTRRMVLSSKGNPYYHNGTLLKGIGSPHTPMNNVWPMSLMVQIMTSTDAEEVRTCLQMIKTTTAGLGLMHESINAWDDHDYSRPWFAWANAYFALTVLDIADRFPSILF